MDCKRAAKTSNYTKRKREIMDNNILMKKLFLTELKMMVLTSEVEKRSPNKIVLWFLYMFGGIVGSHRIYLKDYLKGFLMFITLGGFGIWYILDFLTLEYQYKRRIDELELRILKEITTKDFV